MDYVDGKCPVCGKEFRIPKGAESCHCSFCGNKVLSSAAIAYASAKSSSEGVDPLDAVDNGENYGRQDGASLETLEETDDAPFLGQWKTSIGLFLLGAFLSAAFNVGTTRLPAIDPVFDLLVVIAPIPIILLYALWIYPSLFKREPKLKSSKTTSFLNGLIGGIIFGALWNASLTKKKKGVSQYVLTGALVIGLVAIVASYAIVISGTNEFSPNETSQQRIEEGNDAMQSNSEQAMDQGTQGEKQGSSDLPSDVYTNPEKYATTESIRKVVAEGRVTSWDKASPVLHRVTFGYIDASGDWCPATQQESLPESNDVAGALILAILQMTGDFDETTEIWSRVQDASIMESLGSAVFWYEPVEFTVDGEKWYICLNQRYERVSGCITDHLGSIYQD